jgi:hypothetical protein
MVITTDAMIKYKFNWLKDEFILTHHMFSPVVMPKDPPLIATEMIPALFVSEIYAE